MTFDNAVLSQRVEGLSKYAFTGSCLPRVKIEVGGAVSSHLRQKVKVKIKLVTKYTQLNYPKRRAGRGASLLFILIGITGATVVAQTANTEKPAPDILLLVDGEKLIGQLKSATGASLVFHSDIAGDVTIDWSKVSELHTNRQFAAIPKNVKLHKTEEAATVPQGTVAMSSQKVEVTGGKTAAQTIPVGDIGIIVDQPSFEAALTHRNFLQGWKGGATAGLSLTEATQNSQSFTAAVGLVRAVPGVSWLDLRSRTLFNFNEAYGKISQPGTPDVKTSLYHIDAEQDWYLSPRLFAFAHTAFDHSFSQGLSLQQLYGGGVGVVAVKSSNQELDLKASMDYINQRFDDSSLNNSLVGTTFGETYVRTFPHKILFSQQAGFTPAWNDTSAFSAFASAGLTFPVYHRLGLTIGAIDNFLNNPPPTFRKNSFQLTVGATYSFQ